MKGDQPLPPSDSTPAKRDLSATLCVVAVAFVVFLLLLIPTGPLRKYRASARQVEGLREELKQAYLAKEAELARLRSQEVLMTRLKERKPNFNLWSFMNTILTETKLSERANLENYRPRGDRKGAAEHLTMVQLRLTGITLKELVDLLYKVYSNKDLVVLYRLEFLRVSGDNKGLECYLIFFSPKAPAPATA